jgi:hypothetical protein
MSYPQEFYKKQDGNLVQKYANTKEDESNLRSAGFQTLEELYGVKEPKKK